MKIWCRCILNWETVMLDPVQILSKEIEIVMIVDVSISNLSDQSRAARKRKDKSSIDSSSKTIVVS